MASKEVQTKPEVLQRTGESGQPLHSLMLKVPHHAGDTSLTVPFSEDVSPEVAIDSMGADNCFGHPDEPTLEKLGAIQTYRTHQHGCIELVKMARGTGSGLDPGCSPRASGLLRLGAEA